MRRAVLIIAAAMLLTAPSLKAQTGQSVSESAAACQEVSIGSGVFSVPQFALMVGAVFGAAFSFGQFSVDNLQMSTAISMEYYYHLNPHVALGGAAVVDGMWGDEMRKDNSTGQYVPVGRYSGLFASLMPAAKFGWFTNDHFQMYSKLAAGGMVSTIPSDTESNVQISPAFQVSPVCIAAGGGHVWGKLEFGLGMMGLIQAGVVYRL